MIITDKNTFYELIDLICENKDLNKEELTQMLNNWIKKKNQCNCSRCTGLSDIESYYEEEEDVE